MYIGNASLIESITSLHVRIGLGLVLEKKIEFGLNLAKQKLDNNR